MISDSPYSVSASVLSPRQGIVAGFAAACVMLLILYVLLPAFGTSFDIALAALGNGTVMGGIAILLLLGVVFGLLYAVSQMRIRPGALIGVGIFYGFVLWVLTALLIGSVLGETLRTSLRSLPFLGAWIVYGLCLALAAIWQMRRSQGSGVIVPRD